MIIIELFFFVFGFFVLLVLSLAALLVFKIRFHLQSPFLHPNSQEPMQQGGNTIEGDYVVIENEPSRKP